MRKEVSQEKMRYSVPGVCNRFLGVHIGFILLCALLSVMVVCVTLSIIVIGGVQELEPKPSIVFYCEADAATVAAAKDKYSSVFDLYFVANGDDEYIGIDGAHYSVDNNTLAIVYNKHGSYKWIAKYEDCGLKRGTPITVADIQRVVEQGADKV